MRCVVLEQTRFMQDIVKGDLDQQARAVELEAGFALDSLEEKRMELRKWQRILLSEHQVPFVWAGSQLEANPNSLCSGAAEHTTH